MKSDFRIRHHAPTYKIMCVAAPDIKEICVASVTCWCEQFAKDMLAEWKRDCPMCVFRIEVVENN